MVAEVAATMGSRLESSVRQAVESLAGLRGAPEECPGSGRSYAGAVRASEAGSVPRAPRGLGVRFDESVQSRQETIEVVPGKEINERFSDAQATCNAVLASIKPNEVGIKIDRVVKGRNNKSVRIVASHDELNKLKPMLISMSVRNIDKLNPRLLVRDIPAEVEK